MEQRRKRHQLSVLGGLLGQLTRPVMRPNLSYSPVPARFAPVLQADVFSNNKKGINDFQYML